MRIEDRIEALDSVDCVLDCVLGSAEALRLRGCANGEDDYVCRMVSSVLFEQADRLMEVAAWLGVDESGEE